MQKKEVWRDVKNYEGRYQVSSFGRVRSVDREVLTIKNVIKFHKGRILSHGDDGYGYLCVSLHKHSKSKSFKVHQLVAIAFLHHTPCGFKLVVDHVNNIKTDNNAYNLQIITTQQNCIKRQNKAKHQATINFIKLKKCISQKY